MSIFSKIPLLLLSSKQKIMNTTKQIVETFLQAVQKGDNQTIAALLHPDLLWQQPGNNRFAGSYKSATEVFQMIAGMYEVTQNTLSLADVVFVGSNGNEVACLLHFTATKTDQSLDSKN